MRTVLAIALVFVGVFAFLTFYVILRTGPDLLTVLSVLVLAVLGFGIRGALQQPPNRRR
jgi:hypothetical protein